MKDVVTDTAFSNYSFHKHAEKYTTHIAACKHVTVRGVWLPFHNFYFCVF